MNPTDPAIRVNDAGRVGVGTTSPGARFMVVGTDGAPTLNVLHDGMDPMNPAIRVNDNGNVGFGTTTPAARVQVADGDVYISDASNGIIMTSPSGTCFRVTISDMGEFQNMEIACPN